MPTTASRWAYVKRSIALWQRQSYPLERRELVIYTNADPDNSPFPTPGVTVFVEDGWLPLGAKRNAVNRRAQGNIIIHWDDDDWSCPERIMQQVQDLERSDLVITGLRDMFWMRSDDHSIWCYHYPERMPGVCGNTMAYRRNFWMEHPIPEVQNASDVRWMMGSEPTIYIAPNDVLVVGLVHDNNVSTKKLVPPSYVPWLGGDARTLLGDDVELF